MNNLKPSPYPTTKTKTKKIMTTLLCTRISVGGLSIFGITQKNLSHE